MPMVKVIGRLLERHEMQAISESVNQNLDWFNTQQSVRLFTIGPNTWEAVTDWPVYPAGGTGSQTITFSPQKTESIYIKPLEEVQISGKKIKVDCESLEINGKEILDSVEERESFKPGDVVYLKSSGDGRPYVLLEHISNIRVGPKSHGTTTIGFIARGKKKDVELPEGDLTKEKPEKNYPDIVDIFLMFWGLSMAVLTGVSLKALVSLLF